MSDWETQERINQALMRENDSLRRENERLRELIRESEEFIARNPAAVLIQNGLDWAVSTFARW